MAPTTNVERAKAFLQAIEAREDLTPFLAPDVIQHELPNRFIPSGATRDLTGILAACERGQRAMVGERFEVVRVIAQGDDVALEVVWTGTLAVPIGALPAGGTMRAQFGMFMTFRDGRIVSQRNYDCFDPF